MTTAQGFVQCRTQSWPWPGTGHTHLPTSTLLRSGYKLLLPWFSSNAALTLLFSHADTSREAPDSSARLSRSHPIFHLLPSECHRVLTLCPLNRPYDHLLLCASLPFSSLRMPVLLSPLRIHMSLSKMTAFPSRIPTHLWRVHHSVYHPAAGL